MLDDSTSLEKMKSVTPPSVPDQVVRDSWMPSLMTCALIIMVVALVAALLWVPTPSGNADVIHLIAGQIIGAFATAVAYWLGSSRSSHDKQRLLTHGAPPLQTRKDGL
ncbi:hypothetical protein HEQ60_10340 [Haematospirillum sp. H1815]|uniref:hypothetical protein n=1 Tax=Haematospirillum sp. H1815 TaxID=2723108 RepID=UPI001439FBB2|nr:hypothetical protein [Haematospirillum sp. H1815]NKD78155.1 hypothetical protein [Haematospirillum sp. H1815]